MLDVAIGGLVAQLSCHGHAWVRVGIGVGVGGKSRKRGPGDSLWSAFRDGVLSLVAWSHSSATRAACG